MGGCKLARVTALSWVKSVPCLVPGTSTMLGARHLHRAWCPAPPPCLVPGTSTMPGASEFTVLGAWYLHQPQQLTAPSLPVLGGDMHLEVAAPYRVPDRDDQRSLRCSWILPLCSAGSSLSDNTPLIRSVRALCASSSWALLLHCAVKTKIWALRPV